MTVKELKEILNEYPDDATVFIDWDEYVCEIDAVISSRKTMSDGDRWSEHILESEWEQGGDAIGWYTDAAIEEYKTLVRNNVPISTIIFSQ